MPQLQYRNENQNIISNFVFQFIKKVLVVILLNKYHRFNFVKDVTTDFNDFTDITYTTIVV